MPSSNDPLFQKYRDIDFSNAKRARDIPHLAKLQAERRQKMPEYHTDFFNWTQEQAALLKAGNFNALDIDNLIEEVESMGNSQKTEITSYLKQLLLHLLKWKYQPSKRSKKWRVSISNHRDMANLLMAANSGFRQFHDDFFATAYRMARNGAATETDLDKRTFPKECEWTLEQVLTEDWLPEDQV